MTYLIKHVAYILTTIVFSATYSLVIAQSSTCEVIEDGIDLQTKSYRLALAPTLLFNYTPPQIKNDLQENNLLTTQGQIVKIDDQVSLHLNLKVNSLKAQSFYGEVKQENILKVTLINGREITLKCYAGSKGVLSQDRKSYIYPLGYHLSKSDMRALKKKEIDKIGIQWSSGYEDYTIYEVDFFMNQLACLEEVNQQKPN